MAKKNGATNGAALVERHLDAEEIQRYAKKAHELNEKIKKLPKLKAEMVEERDEALKLAGQGYELVEGEELPFRNGARQ
jgi:hypothetical protein